jgi:methylamine dehydrogenase accessory protein MauD
MTTFLVISSIALWVLVLFLAFLLLGVLRNLGLLNWRLDQLQATTPSRLGRDGLKPGKKAPDFTLPSAAGPEVSLHEFSGRRVLLVFVQAHCGPCHQVVPELNKLRHRGEPAVLAVFNGDPEAARKWAAEVKAEFSVLSQEKFAVSKRYEMFATPFAFLIDEKGIIASKGIVNNQQHIGYVLSGVRVAGDSDHADTETEAPANGHADGSASPPDAKEVHHV